MFYTFIVATDDQETFDLLNQNCPEDAFSQGATKQPPKEEAQVLLIIKGLEENIVLDSDINNQL